MRFVIAVGFACATLLAGCGGGDTASTTTAEDGTSPVSATTTTTTTGNTMMCAPIAPTGALAVNAAATAKPAAGGTLRIRRLDQRATLRPTATRSPTAVERLGTGGTYTTDGRFVVVRFEFHNSGPAPMKASTAVAQAMVLVAGGKTYATADGAPGCERISSAYAKTSSRGLTNPEEEIASGKSYSTAVVYAAPAGTGSLQWYAPKLKLKTSL